LSSVAISFIVLGFAFGGALLGVYLRPRLPQHHLTADSKEVVRQGMALVSTMAALVLGLLIASAKGTYDAQAAALVESSARVVVLDRTLAHYGPEAKESRDLLREFVSFNLERTWPKNGASSPTLEAPSFSAEIVVDKIAALAPKDETQRALKSQALTIAWGIGQTRWLQYSQQALSISVPLLMTLVFWITVIFLAFGLFAPTNATVLISLFVSAASVSGAVLMILEFYRPYSGIIRLSSAPVRAALDQLGR
jgi:hypothetical protein